ncbi:MAG: hypothetical protein HQL33_04480 [Alphaproteobacteria bacterium]|nr:hypothetical protein [Alphaproteobacteria bacterium]MBF0129229.1 hypothetical protein [Alphaproteobacteria bacterium]
MLTGGGGGLHYEKMVEDALRGVVRRALEETAAVGLPGSHHFYITFRTRYPGVDIAPHLMDRHPDEMTIVLQNQFWGLDVSEDFFEVTLSFNKVNERLHIPFAAVSAFADPSAKFGLQFNVDMTRERPAPADGFPLPEERPGERADERKEERSEERLEERPGERPGERKELAFTAPPPSRKKAPADGDAEGKVIALDAFRKK